MSLKFNCHVLVTDTCYRRFLMCPPSVTCLGKNHLTRRRAATVAHKMPNVAGTNVAGTSRRVRLRAPGDSATAAFSTAIVAQ